MSHHSQDGTFGPLKPLADQMSHEGREEKIAQMKRELLSTSVGATGQFPDGKLAPHDEGEIFFAVGIKDGRVILDFGKPVHSLGMTPHQAVAIAEMLVSKARSANIIGASKEPLTLTIGDRAR